MHFTRCTSLDVLHSMSFTLIYFTRCTMHLILCTSIDVLHSDVLHSVYYALDSMHFCTSVDVLHSVYYYSVYYYSVYLILCTSLKGSARKNPSRCFREKGICPLLCRGTSLYLFYVKPADTSLVEPSEMAGQ